MRWIRVAASLGMAAVLSAPAVAQEEVADVVPITEDMSDPLRAAVLLHNGGTPPLADQKVVGGVEASPGADPWQVALIYTTPRATIPFCGGSIIANRWVITAAHCVERMKPYGLKILSGATNLDDTAQGVRHPVKEIYIHGDFQRARRNGESVLENDVALLELTVPTDLLPIDAADAQQTDSLRPGVTPVRVTGWGATAPRRRTQAQGEMQRKLQAAELVIIASSDCNDPVSYDGLITPAMICAGHRTAVRDACNGDSGGPLTAVLADKPRLVGVVSWGHGCAQPEKFGVYARVATFRPWIEQCLTTTTCPRRRS